MIAWYAHQLPESILIAAAAITLFIEIFVPFMMFLPRRYRFIAAWLTIGLQLLIMLTSNHNWLNILTIALCLFLFDDKALKKVIPIRLQAWLLAQHSPAALLTPLSRIGLLGLSAFILLISSVQTYEMIAFERLDGRLGDVTRKVEAFRIVNQYHVFPTMPEKRFELLIYGSNDGQSWQQFRFKYYPDSPDKRPEAIIMKTLQTLLTSAVFASVAAMGTAQADSSLSSLIYEESSNIYTDVSYEKSTAASIRSYGDDHNQDSVWSYEYEQYVNPGDFTQTDVAGVGDVNQYMGSNPTAAGQSSGNVFIYNETAGEYHLQ